SGCPDEYVNDEDVDGTKHIEDDHQRPEETDPFEPRDAGDRQASHHRTIRGRETVGDTITELVSQYRGLSTDIDEVGKWSHDRHGECRLPAARSDNVIDGALCAHHADRCPIAREL